MRDFSSEHFLLQDGSKIAVIGGGPAGLAAAVAAKNAGAKSIVILERDKFLGGILQQCIHNGFGLHYFGEELTGPEYAQLFIDKVAGLVKKLFIFKVRYVSVTLFMNYFF